MRARQRILFVTHTVDPFGGAGRSLRELLRAYQGVEADLMLPRFHGAPDDDAIRRFFGPRIRRIFRAWLPYAMCYRGRPAVWESARRHLLFPLCWRLCEAGFHRFVARERYDAVHLNSLVLHPMVRADGPFLLHVREILDRGRPAAQRSAARAHGVLFIDEATRAPFAGAPLRRHVVLNNPVDMTAVGRLPADAASRIGGDPEALTVFSLVGTLIPEKGAELVIRAVRAARARDVRLLLVGTGMAHYVAGLRRLAGDDPRIVFWGNAPDVADLYTLSDYVLRGEAYACIGRTIYEALYAGCAVVIPGDPSSHAVFEHARFAERIRFYPPGDEARLTAIVDELAGHKLRGKRGTSNVAEYVSAFDRFVREAIGRPPDFDRPGAAR